MSIIEKIKSNTLVILAYRALGKIGFGGTVDYWEKRYQKGGTSGAGSYGEFAQEKARVINGFVKEEGLNNVIEFGCGDGNQLTMADYPEYLGVDVSKTAIVICREKFAGDLTKSFLWHDPNDPNYAEQLPTAELTLSLEVIFHLIEDDIFEKYMNDLFAHSEKFVLIFSSNYDSTVSAAHVRHRKFTDHVEKYFPNFSLYKVIEHDQPKSFSEFYIFKIDANA